jgi:hypothetical protein
MVRKTVSIGVQTAVMIDCDARIPLLVYGKLHGFNVKDPVDLAIVRPGRLIHESFARVTTRLAEEGRIVERETVEKSLAVDIAVTLPELARDEVIDHAMNLSVAVQEAFATGPEKTISHEKHVSVPLAPGVKLTGRVDTIIEDADGLVIVERKSGHKQPWHILQIQVYAEMACLIDPKTKIIKLELWYSRYGTEAVPITAGEMLESLKTAASKGVALAARDACDIYSSWCAECPRRDCGVKRLRLARARRSEDPVPE